MAYDWGFQVWDIPDDHHHIFLLCQRMITFLFRLEARQQFNRLKRRLPHVTAATMKEEIKVKPSASYCVNMP